MAGDKDKKLSKAQEKKKLKKDLEKKIQDRIATVLAANKVEDHLKDLPSFQKYKKDQLCYTLNTQPVEKLDQPTKDWIMDLTIRNMKTEYENSSLGWDEEEKRKELLEESNARYLIAKDEDEKYVAFVHFRFDIDQDFEVLFVYEVQLEKEVRRQGLGRFMMRVLEFLAWKADMRKITLAVGKSNLEAGEFFKKCLGFQIDAYEKDFVIVSKVNMKKLERESNLENNEANLEKMTVNVKKPQGLGVSLPPGIKLVRDEAAACAAACAKATGRPMRGGG